MALSRNWSSFAITRISLAANIILNSKANRTDRIRCSRDSFRRVWANRLVVRRTLEPIKNRRAKSLRGNSFRNDKIETKHVELAQVAKEIRCGLPQILMRAQISNCDKFQRAAVSSPPPGTLQIFLP